MKRILLMVLLGWLVSVVAVAGALTEEQARKIALDFRKSGARSVTQLELVYTGLAGQAGTRSVGEPAFYVYNYVGNQGFVIVSGEDTTLPILAFAENGQFVTGEKMPVQVKSWLQGYCDYIQQVRSGARYVEPAPDLGLDISIAVAPLVQAQWDQAEPYNYYCPPFSAVENCATGCAATAIAQIMHYHEWPETGEGSVTFGGKVIDFSQSHYDWNNMLDSYLYGTTYPQLQVRAVAKLMYDVGVSAGMQYGYESGAQNVDIYRSLYTYFKYSKQMQYLVRNAMTTAEWKGRIRQELDAGRPVYYGGFAEDMSMGHAFVCDGIDETNNYFHFNWGWSGHCNGYYFLNNLNPPILGVGGGTGNFNADHVAIVGIQPAVEGETDCLTRAVLLMRKGFYTNTNVATLGRNFYVQIGNVWNLGPEAVKTRLAVAMYDAEGNFVRTVGSQLDLSLGAFVGMSSMSIPVSIPRDTPEGAYELRVVHGSGNGDWEELPYYYDCYQRIILLSVEGNSVSLRSPAQSEVVLQAQLHHSLPGTLLPGKKYQLQVDFKNVGNWNFDGRIGYRLLQLPDVIDNVDTLTVLKDEDMEFIYSEDAKSMKMEFRLTHPSDYLLQAYYIDPLSFNEVIAGEWPLALAEPAGNFTRRVVMEQLWKSGDHQALQKLLEAYPDKLIGLTVVESEWPDYVDSLDMPVGTSVLMNRVRHSDLASAADAESYLLDWLTVPAVASIEAEAKYTTRENDSVKVTLTTCFAYAADSLDMRFAVVTLDRDSVDGGDSGWTYSNRVTGYFPAEAWSGASDSIPSTVEVGKEYTYTLTLKPQYKGELVLVGLLIDGQTGEICNAVSLHQDEIAPMEGEVQPMSVNLERPVATMNMGIKVVLPVSVSPAIASQEVQWTSSCPEVAAFNEWGQLEALAPGTTVIRAASVVNPDVYAEMQLTVQATDYSQVQHVEAGYLHYLVDFDSCPEKLVLDGEINGTDIALLRTLSGGDNIVGDYMITLLCPLDSLDISQCRIVAGGKPYYKDYMTENDVVGKEMFKWCLFLKEIVLPVNLVAIGDNAFAESSRGDMKNIEIPATVKTIGYAPFRGCQGFEAFTVAEGNTAYKAVDGVLYNYAGTELVAYPAARKDSVYESVETLTRILPYAFNEASNLTRFSANLRLSSIGYGAFCNAWRLEEVNLSNRLNFVDEYAFAGCQALKSISCKRVTPAECAANAFDGVPEDCVLNLPDNFDEEYYTAPGWSRFTDVRTSVDDTLADTGIRVSAVAGGVIVKGAAAGDRIFVYTPTGTLVTVAEAVAGETRIPLSASGIYIIHFSGFNTKVVVR